MGIAEIFLIAVGLSMDAFAAAVCKGLSLRKPQPIHAAVIGLMFGVFQACMPVIGWYFGNRFEEKIVAVDHWIAFGLLAFVGFKMLPLKKNGEESHCSQLNLKELILMALATSIDALAVGITFSFLKVRIVSSVIIIGCTTFAVSAVGVAIGCRFGENHRKKAETAGGVILICMGLKILMEHLAY